MIARLFIMFKPGVYIPEGEKFSARDYEIDGLKVVEYYPARSDKTENPRSKGTLKIDGVPTFFADTLKFDFVKIDFDRTVGSETDPSLDVLSRAVNSYLMRLRHVAQAGLVRSVNLPLSTWSLNYLNDDESELAQEEGKRRGIGGGTASLSYIAFNKQVWEDMHRLAPEYAPMPWESILLDAGVELPQVGPAIVLTQTALEVFISHHLDRLAEHKQVSPSLWSWVTDRGNHDRDPSVSEKFDILLRELTGHSLKDESALWKAFQNLKSARNAFVHEGTARIGEQEIREDVAAKLIQDANRIISKVREWTPEALQWPEIKSKVNLQISFELG